ncbi:MAG: InlB B-repeat-containing protein [Parabacteroides sp.]|nr:InlB B-repeat-containing protein [Parabacteroides sp.]
MNKSKQNIKYWLVLILLLCGLSSVKAENVHNIKSASELASALNKNKDGVAVVNGNIVTLLEDCTSTGRLSIDGGEMTLDLGGHTLSYSTVDGKNGGGEAVCIRVTSGAIIVKNGSIVVESEKGANSSAWVSGDGGPGKNALGIVLDEGSVKFFNLSFELKPGKGGSKKGWGNDGADGIPYILKANNTHTVSDMVPKGVVLLNESEKAIDYSGYKPSEGIQVKVLSAEYITYKVNYNLVGGKEIISGSKEYTCQEANFIFPQVSKDGYKLKNWLSGEKVITENDLDYPYPTSSTQKPTELSVDFKAVWEAIQYHVKYTGEGINYVDGIYSIEEDIDKLPEPTREGYRFAGWYREGVEVSSVPKGTGDVTLIAHWLKIYGINYNVDGGDMPDTYEKEYTEEDEFILPIPKKGTAYFDGWFDKTGKRYEKINKGSSGNLELTARWSERYVITFDVNGEDASSKPSDVEFSQNTDGKKLSTNVTRLGYTFTSWYEDAACMKLFGTSIPAGTIGNKTLYAGWKLTEYTILFYNAPFDKEPIDRLSYTIKDEKALPIPTKTSFTFNGWYNQKKQMNR